MELLDKSLEEIFQQLNQKFSIKTVCMVGIQMLDRVEFIHNESLIHRDIKPENFAIGLGNKSHIIYMIDFGLYKKYRNRKTHEHIKFETNKKFSGTARYASINNLKGYQQSRRDDLESIAYVLLYFLRGNLPWQGLHADKREDKYKKILEKKQSISAEELCEGFPNEFVEFINYTRNLEFEEEPNYKFLKELLYTVLEKQNCKYDFWYDWISEKPIITDRISVERYMNKNSNISLKNEDKKCEAKEKKNNIKEEKKEKYDDKNINSSEENAKNNIILNKEETLPKDSDIKNNKSNTIISEGNLENDKIVKKNESLNKNNE